MEDSPSKREKIDLILKKTGEKVDDLITKGYTKIDSKVSKYRIRRILIVFTIILALLGTILGAFGTYSSLYTIKKVSFTNQTFYQKALEYGPIYQPLNVSLVPDEPLLYTVSAYVFTPTGRPVGYEFPTVIWSHGMVVNAEFQMHYAMEMAAAGFKVVAINLDGHGDSGGFWSIGLSNIQTFYAAVEYAASLPDVNTSEIVVSGHSNGGYAAARAGLFDKTPLGTGGLIKAVASMWTASDMNETFHELVGWGEPINNPRYSWLIPMFMGTPQVMAKPEDLLRRSINDYVNETNLPNWYVVSGSTDQMSSDKVMYSAMAAAVRTQATADSLRTTVESSWSNARYGQWNNLAHPNISFTNGTARQIGIFKGMDHAGEAFDPDIIQNVIAWFRLALHLNFADYQTRMEQGINVMGIWIARMGGWSMLISAMILGQIYLVVTLAPVFFPERQRKYQYVRIRNEAVIQNQPVSQYDGFLPPGLDEYLVEVQENTPRQLVERFANTFRKKIKFFIGLTLCIAGGVAIFFVFRPMPVTPIWIFNAYLWQYMFAGILVWGYALWVFYRYRKSKYFGPYVSLERVGGSWSGLGRGFLYSLCIVGIPVTIFNILEYIIAMPKLWPRPAETGIWGYAIIGGIMIWVLYLPLETMIKTQLFQIYLKYPTKSGFWLEIIANALFVFLIWMFGYLIGSLFMGTTLWGMIFLGNGFGKTLFIVVNAMMFIINGSLTFVTSLMYQRTRNVFACSLYPVFMCVLIIFGKLFGIYSLFA